MTDACLPQPAVGMDDASDRALSEALFDALRGKTSDGTGITRASYGEGESAALDIIEAKTAELIRSVTKPPPWRAGASQR